MVSGGPARSFFETTSLPAPRPAPRKGYDIIALQSGRLLQTIKNVVPAPRLLRSAAAAHRTETLFLLFRMAKWLISPVLVKESLPRSSPSSSRVSSGEYAERHNVHDGILLRTHEFLNRELSLDIGHPLISGHFAGGSCGSSRRGGRGVTAACGAALARAGFQWPAAPT